MVSTKILVLVGVVVCLVATVLAAPHVSHNMAARRNSDSASAEASNSNSNSNSNSEDDSMDDVSEDSDHVMATTSASTIQTTGGPTSEGGVASASVTSDGNAATGGDNTG